MYSLSVTHSKPRALMALTCPERCTSSFSIPHFVNLRPKSSLLSIKAVAAQTSEPACAQRESVPNQAQASACLQDRLLPQIVQYWSQVTISHQKAHCPPVKTCENQVQVNKGNHKQFCLSEIRCSVVKCDCPYQGSKAQYLCLKGTSRWLKDNTMTSNQAFKTGGKIS